MEQKSNKGMIGMVLGIIGLALSALAFFIGIWASIVGLVLGIIAIVMGVKGRKEGDGKGTAGLVTGIIAVVFGGIVTICVACTLCAAASIVGGANQLANEFANELSAYY